MDNPGGVGEHVPVVHAPKVDPSKSPLLIMSVELESVAETSSRYHSCLLSNVKRYCKVKLVDVEKIE